MTHLRTTITVALTLCTIGAVAAPAFGWFEGTGPSKSEGGGKAGATVIGLPGGEAGCASDTYEYKTWSKFQAIILGRIVQSPRDPGQHLARRQVSPVGCTITAAGKKEAAELSGCETDLVQESKGSTSATFDIVEECVFKTAVCVIKVPQAAANEVLKGSTLTNSGTSLIMKDEVGGLTVNVNAGCKAIGLSSTTTGTYKSEATGENLKAI